MERGEIIASRLKAAREAMHPKMIQKEVAKKLECSAAIISLYENGGSQPPIDTLIALSEMYGVTIDWILGVDSAASKRKPATLPGITLVPFLPRAALVKWQFDNMEGSVQTGAEYPADQAAAIELEGRAMLPTTGPNCIAIVVRDIQLEQGGLVMVLADGSTEPTLRRVDRDGGMVMFVADDPRYPALTQENCRVIGQVAELIRRTILK